MAAFIAQAEAVLLSLEEQINSLEQESADKDAEIRRLLMNNSTRPAALKREVAAVLIRPEGVQRGIVGEICSKFEIRGCKLVAIKLVLATKLQIETFYADIKNQPHFPGLMAHMLRGPVVIMVWEACNIVKLAKMMTGAIPKDSDPGSIRGDYCISSGHSLVDVSESAESAIKEIDCWFPEGLSGYHHHSESWIYETPLDDPSITQ